ncbi:ATP-binding protein [Piscinibacter sakaiensis]|uniref:ATP-binding protein n=1 Tax=Piscinibacter sakaiensis TaxID=1547922 RepID=UPI003AAAA9CC
MIITHLRAENFLKYAELELSNLPASGLIAVSGPNESGKSAIGETICFALFGRTYSVAADAPEKLIRWGAPRCNVSVDFRGKNGRSYRISRYLDAEGTQGARLESLDDGETTLAKGAEHVAVALPGLTGFDYEEFVESFYLPQRELTTPHPDSHALMAMAGIAPLARIRKELQEANAQDAAANVDTARQIAELETQLAELDIDKRRLPDLETTRATVSSVQKEKSERLARLQQSVADYKEKYPAAYKARSAQRKARLFAFLFFAIAAVLWGGWVALTQRPDLDVSQQLSAWLANSIPGWQIERVAILWAAVVATILFVVSLAISARQGGRFGKLADHAHEAARQIGVARESAGADIRGPLENVARLVPAAQPNPTNAASPESAKAAHSESKRSSLPASVAALGDRTSRFDVDTDEIQQTVDAIEPALLNQSKTLQDQVSLVDRAIGEEQRRLREAEKLEAMRDQHRETHRAREHHVRVREMGISLLESASRERSHLFNKEVRSLAGGALPRFTDDRYQHLQIDESLSVRVFSNEKHDFMDFDEISSGTQRQIMLAVRLALSQELIRSTVGGAQFIFLDEPFAFFDEQRMLNTLHALPQLSDELAQIWIITQHLPEAARVDAHIRCSRETEELRVATPDVGG